MHGKTSGTPCSRSTVSFSMDKLKIKISIDLETPCIYGLTYSSPLGHFPTYIFFAFLRVIGEYFFPSLRASESVRYSVQWYNSLYISRGGKYLHIYIYWHSHEKWKSETCDLYIFFLFLFGNDNLQLSVKMRSHLTPTHMDGHCLACPIMHSRLLFLFCLPKNVFHMHTCIVKRLNSYYFRCS